jgi:hypothetical protein
MPVHTARQAFAGLLVRIEALCPDTHLTLVRRWEDVLDTWPSDDTLDAIKTDLLDALECLGLEVLG